ncbi:MAG: hypothetical protein U0176_08895 [Bacteroidia bacterium]
MRSSCVTVPFLVSRIVVRLGTSAGKDAPINYLPLGLRMLVCTPDSVASGVPVMLFQVKCHETIRAIVSGDGGIEHLGLGVEAEQVRY